MRNPKHKEKWLDNLMCEALTCQSGVISKNSGCALWSFGPKGRGVKGEGKFEQVTSI